MRKIFTAIALAGIIATPAFATTIQHRPAASSRHLYMYEPGVAPNLQSNPTPQQDQQRTYGPSSMDFNYQAWPGGRPSRY
jgi:hypothetical protein